MKNHAISLVFLICLAGSVYSQNEENPWLFEIGVNSVNAEAVSYTHLTLPTKA